MPSPSPVFQLSADGGTTWLPADTSIAGPNALALAGGSTSVKARLISQAGVGTVEWGITSQTAAAPTLTLTTNTDKSVSFPVPNGTAAAWLLRLKVNGGVDPKTGKADASLVRSLAIKVLTSGGGEFLAPGEENESDRAEGWVRSYNAFVGNGGVGGSALPTPWSATVDGGLNLKIGAPNVVGASGRNLTIHAQPSATGTGSTLRLGAGGGMFAGSEGGTYLGYYTPGGTFVDTMLSRAGEFAAFRTDGWPLFQASRPNDAIELLTYSFTVDETQSHILEYDETYEDVRGAEAIAGFVWAERFSDGLREVMRGNSRDGVTITRRVTVLSEAGNARTVESVYETDTLSTTAFPLADVILGTSESVSITVLATADNGSTTGEVVKKAVFRRAAADSGGNLTQQGGGADFDASVPAFKLGHDITLTTDGVEAVYVNVKAATSAYTKWTVAISVVSRLGVV